MHPPNIICQRPTTIYLVRHGQSLLNVAFQVQGSDDTPNGLSPQGKQQIRALAERLSSVPFTHCFSSPFRRAQETAALLVSGRQIPVVTLDSLREKDQGESAGMQIDAFMQQYTNWHNLTEDERLDMTGWPHEETQRALRERAFNTLSYLVSHYEGATILAVSHGSFMRSIYQYLMQYSFAQMWKFHNGGYMAIRCDSTGLHIQEVSQLEHVH